MPAFSHRKYAHCKFYRADCVGGLVRFGSVRFGCKTIQGGGSKIFMCRAASLFYAPQVRSAIVRAVPPTCQKELVGAAIPDFIYLHWGHTEGCTELTSCAADRSFGRGNCHRKLMMRSGQMKYSNDCKVTFGAWPVEFHCGHSLGV